MGHINHMYAMAIFGRDAVLGDMGVNMRPRGYLVRYIGRLVARVWHHAGHRVDRDIREIKKLNDRAAEQWKGKHTNPHRIAVDHMCCVQR